MDDPKDIVRKGYDQLSDHYRRHFSLSHITEYKTWIDNLLQLVPKDEPILELGCGDGIPVAQMVSNNHRYFGIDISPVQISNAKLNVPAGHFMTADMKDLHYPSNHFGGIIALYSLIHIPLQEQIEVINNMYQWLQPGGYFLCTTGAEEWTGVEHDWICDGITMYWSHADAETYAAWFSAAGFSLVKKEYIREESGGHVLFLLKKNGR